MISRGVGIVAAFALVAATLVPRASQADDPSGYAGRGALVVQTNLAGASLTVGGNIAFEERDPLLRIDVLSLGIPGMDGATSALLSTQLFPPGGFTVIYDRRRSTYTVWSNAKRAYYTPPQAGGPQARATTPPPSSAAGVATPSSTNGLLAVFSFLRSLKDDRTFRISFTMTGHGTVNGHPATGLSFAYLKTTSAGETDDFHGQIQLADDLNEIPVQLQASVKTGTIPVSSLRIDATSIAQANPSDADFAVPAGYARANGLGDVIGNVLPH